MEDVFDIDEASPLSDNQWQIKGKAWQTLQVGEIVYGAVGRTYEYIREPDKIYHILHEPEGGAKLYPFQIVAISTYGRGIDFLSRGLTGTLTLEGDNGETLLDTKYLVVLEEPGTG